MKRIFIVIITAYCLLLTACKPKERIVYVDRVHDSIVVHTVKDTVLKYAPQKQQVITPKKSHLETDLASSDAFIDSSGLLNHSIQNKGLIPGKVYNNDTKIHDSIPYPVEVIKEVPVKGDPYPVEKKVYVRGYFWYAGLFLHLLLFIIILNKLNKQFSLWQKLTKGWKN